jgi:hypothetical protein
VSFPKRFFIWIVFGIGALFVVVALIPSARYRVQSFFDHGYTREVLATAEGDVLGDGKRATVIKYRGPESIFVEIVDSKDPSILLGRIVLPDKRDGYFNLRGHVTRLAVSDIDDDGKNELLIPTFDDQLIPHLNIYRYNADLKRFDAVKAP